MNMAHQANPLVDPRDKRLPRIAGPCGVVIFGVTGDLSRKKLMPAIYDLANRGLLPPGFALVGFARREWADEDFTELVHEAVREHARTPFREDVWAQLSEGIRFVPGSFEDDAAFDELAGCVAQLDQERGTGGNHAFYLAIPPAMFPVVLKQLARTGLAEQTDEQWRRVVIEKPFGHDLRSAQELNEIVNDVFPEESEPALRTDLEQPLCGSCTDHHGRGYRGSRQGWLLRRHRCSSGRYPEPPDPVTRFDHDGGAPVLLPRIATG